MIIQPSPNTPLDWSHAATEIPSAGRAFTRQATAAECHAVAAALGILGCAKLEASYKLRPLGKGRYQLEGPCTAAVTQACVATLAPVAASLTLPLDLVFALDAATSLSGGEEVEVSELPEIEPIENGRLDIGRVVFETLAAGLDPYPRAREAAFSWLDPKDTGEKPNPFAVLATLKPRDPGDEAG